MTSKSLLTWKRLAVLSVGPLLCACGDSETKNPVPDASPVREAGPAQPDLPIVSDVAPAPVDVGPGRLDATVIDVPVTAETAETVRPADDTDSRILAMYADQLSRDKVSLSAIQREIYGRQIPADFYHIQELVRQYQAQKRAETTTTTTTTTENQPDLGSVAA